MQTRTPGLRVLTLALAGVLTLGLAACDDTETVTPLPNSELTISPSGTVDLRVGDRIAVVANLTNSANTTVTWASSNQAVATVDANGTVTAVAPGITTITATATGNQGTLRQALAVRVTAATTPPAQTDSARISIIGIVDPNNNPVAPDSVVGQIFVRTDYTRGAATRVQVLVNNTVACEQTFGAATAQLPAGVSAAQAAQVEFVCPINTARIDPTTGAPTFPNGDNIRITARLLNAAGTTLAQANSQANLRFRNVNNLNLTVTATKQGIGANGLQWFDGDLTIRANPAIFVSGTTIARITATATALQADGTTRTLSATDSTAADGLSVVFFEGAASSTIPASQSLGGTNAVTDGNLVFTVTAVTAAGQQFMFPTTTGFAASQATPAIRYDNVAPVAPAFNTTAGGFGTGTNRYVGSSFSFASTGSSAIVAAGSDPQAPTNGSNSVTTTFAFIPASGNASVTTTASQSTLATAFASGTVVTSGSQVPASNTNTTYILLARAVDAVGNTTYTRAASLFGSDPNAPSLGIAAGSPADNAINPGSPYVLTFSDDISGPDAISVQTTFTDANGTWCYNAATAAFTAVGSSGCSFVDITGTTLAIPTANDGYYTFNIRSRDLAGNVSQTITRTVLVDAVLPLASVTSVALASGQITVGGVAADSVDVMAYDTRLQFTGYGSTLPFGTATTVGAFGLPAVGTATASGSVQAIRGLQATDAVGDLTATIYPLSGAGFGVYDVASNFQASSFVTVASPTASNGTADTGLNRFLVTATAGDVCRPGSTDAACTASSPVPTTRTLRARASGPSGTFNQPFSRVLFYRTGPGGEYRLIGTATTASATDTGSGTLGRTWEYTATLNGSDFSSATTTNVIAVGVDSQGDAVVTQPFTVTVR